MGLLGDAIPDRLPPIPPLPGRALARGGGGGTMRDDVSVRSSVPGSSDDSQIANLRLSVFSRFDQEQQRLFRSRSVEVLNVRRKRGAVVLVAEVPREEEKVGENGLLVPFVTEMQMRIASGHNYGKEHRDRQRQPTALTMTSALGAQVDGFSSLANARASTPTPITTTTPNNEGSSIIIGSVECSHQEFHGTMLGASHPKNSLLYVTEVAVRADARRRGAGAALMRGVDEVAALRDVATVYLHVDVNNRAACAMYEKGGYRYLDKRMPVYAQFTASLNLHDGAMHGRKHHLMCKDFVSDDRRRGRQ